MTTFLDILVSTDVLIGIFAALFLGVLLVVFFVPPRFVVGDYLEDIEDEARGLLASSAPDSEALDRVIDDLTRLSRVRETGELRRRLIEKRLGLSGA